MAVDQGRSLNYVSGYVSIPHPSVREYAKYVLRMDGNRVQPKATADFRSVFTDR